jgi:hypothetical protein
MKFNELKYLNKNKMDSSDFFNSSSNVDRKLSAQKGGSLFKQTPQ